MTEQKLAADIKKALNENSNKIPEVPINIFFNLWFRGKKFTDTEFTVKMLRFAKIYGFGYIINLGSKRQGTTVNFWYKEDPKTLLEEEN